MDVRDMDTKQDILCELRKTKELHVETIKKHGQGCSITAILYQMTEQLNSLDALVKNYIHEQQASKTTGCKI